MMKTYSTKASDIQREWHVIDAKDVILGQLATRTANLLMGKQKTIFARNAGSRPGPSNSPRRNARTYKPVPPTTNAVLPR